MAATEEVIDQSRIGRRGFPRHYQALGLKPPMKTVPIKDGLPDVSHPGLSEEQVLEAAWAALRAERDRLFQVTRPLVERHAEELALELTTTLSATDYLAVLAYRQALRDLPVTTADPSNPVWPVPPTAQA
ncbi:hypothetical protein WH87_04665 [Devosia epidermidihirudinis]|uniref:Phage tail assembly chaperone-like domain-containing protein n=1 Tax=Devosia epidermidihirudinis TaxID=1293439 RepID=A0A0F5QEV6_9HYPH|nr:hypothetical protein WH87_04665 [Devosia epidermidihirudinis]